MTRPVWLALALILLLSSLIQWTTVHETDVIAPARPDAASYVSYAYNLREFGIYSRATTWSGETHGQPVADDVSPPGYPLFLSLFLRDKPDLEFMGRVTLAQAALGVVTTLFSFLLAARILPASTACVVALLTALSPHLATISTYLLTESLFTCLLMISVWGLVRAVQTRRHRDWAMAGLAFGLCCLVRPTLQLAPLLVLLIALGARARPHRRSLAIAGLCWALLLAPWSIYKQRTQDPSGVNLLRATLYHGSFPELMYNEDRTTYGYAYRYDPQAARILSSNSNMRSVLRARMAEHPLRYLRWYFLGKPGFFLSWGIVAGMGDIYIYPVATSPFLERPTFKAVRAGMFALHWPLMLLGVMGSVVALWRRRWLRLQAATTTAIRVVAVVALFAIALHMLGAPYPRYGIPFRPLFYLLGIAMARALWLAGTARLAASSIGVTRRVTSAKV